jgi:dolichyl-phosphate beta-glucosyltransferase
MRISVVLPVYNEERLIASTVDAIVSFMQKQDLSCEILIVDDGSVDGTGNIVKGKMMEVGCVRLLENSCNSGKGYAIRRGVLEAQGDYVLFTDVDLSAPIQEFGKLYDWAARGYDVVIGSRYLSESRIEVHQPKIRRVLGSYYYRLVRAFFLPDIRDTNCGLKCFARDAARFIFSRQRLAGWGFDAEILYIAKKNNFRIKEVPVTWHDCTARSSRVKTYTACFATLKELAQIKMNDWRSLYSAQAAHPYVAGLAGERQIAFSPLQQRQFGEKALPIQASPPERT